MPVTLTRNQLESKITALKPNSYITKNSKIVMDGLLFIASTKDKKSHDNWYGKPTITNLLHKCGILKGIINRNKGNKWTIIRNNTKIPVSKCTNVQLIESLGINNLKHEACLTF